ncbi:MAG: hypothetical protein C0412_14515 [Flavobacterium sp.]|nr:hypothetical protein [Flavobacterium sp.]
MKRIINAISTPIARSSAFFYFGSFVLVFSKYIFHLVLLRLLVPSEYGEFLSYLSLTYLLGIPMGTIANVVTKFVSDYKGKEDYLSINQFFYYLLRVISPITFFLGISLILFSVPLANVFKAHSAAFIILGASIFISLFQTIFNSYVSAFQKFIFQTVVGFVGVIVTIVLSVVFIKIGLGATGAVLGQLISGALISLILFISIRKNVFPQIKNKENPKFNLSKFTGYSFIYALGTASLISVDVLMVRALFDSHTSGLYSSISILGRMILFGLTPFSSLVLPITAHRHSQNSTTHSVFLKLGLVILVFGLLGAGLFSFFPEAIINLLSGPEYLEAAPLLPYFSFSMAFLAYSLFIISYLMATGRPQANVLLLIATVLQPIVFIVFRGSLSNIILVNFLLQLLLFLSLAIYVFLRRVPNPKRI